MPAPDQALDIAIFMEILAFSKPYREVLTEAEGISIKGAGVGVGTVGERCRVCRP